MAVVSRAWYQAQKPGSKAHASSNEQDYLAPKVS